LCRKKRLAFAFSLKILVPAGTSSCFPADLENSSATAGSCAGAPTVSRAGLLKSSSFIKTPLLGKRRRGGVLDEVSDCSAKQRPSDGGAVRVQAAADRNESFPSARSLEQLLAIAYGTTSSAVPWM